MSLLLLALPGFRLPVYPCPEAPAIETQLQSLWEQAETAGKEKNRAEVRRLCDRIDSLARSCPSWFAGYLVAANAKASNLTRPYELRLRFLERGEEAMARYGPYLTDSFYLSGYILLHFERCRYEDSMGELSAAAECYERVWERLPASHPDELLLSFRNALPLSIAQLYYDMGDFVRARQWLDIIGEDFYAGHPIYPGVTLNLRAQILQSQNAFAEAIARFQAAEKAFLKEEEGRASSHFINNYVNLANLHLLRSEPGEALAVLRKALSFNSPHAYSQLYLQYQFAVTYLAADSLGQALEHCREALRIVRSVKPGTYFWTGRVLGTMGEILARQGEWPAALDTFQVALHHVSNQPIEPDWGYSPDPRQSDTKLDLLKVLVLKAATLDEYFRKTKPAATKLLDESLHTALQAIDLIRILRVEYFDDEVKEFLSQRSFPVFERALAAALDLYESSGLDSYLSTAFAIMETSKALSLLENLRDLEAREFADLPERIIEEENRLQFKIATLERSVSQEGDATQKQALQQELKRTQGDFRALQDLLQHDFPEYHQLKYETSPVSLEQVQSSLDNDVTLLEYFYGERRIYAFSVNRSGIHYTSFPNDQAFADKLDDFLALVRSPRNLATRSGIRPYLRLGHALYRQLLDPLDIRSRRLMVIPDGPLHYLPFAALLTEEPERVASTRELPYLIRRHVLSRNFSASVLFQQRQTAARSADKPLLVVSPSAFPSSSQLSLQPAELAAEFGRQVQIERDISKEDFRRLLREGYRNIFIFSHAAASGTEPYLELFEDRFYLRELYATPVAANLILLGACETGLGEQRRGEGVLSLARGFAYQNVPNTIMTLWKVQDGAALRISLNFLRLHLLQQVPVEDALHQAQLQFINNLEQGDGRPFFWAGFVGVGGW